MSNKNQPSCVHCQDFPHCRKQKREAFYGILDCGCSDCSCDIKPPRPKLVPKKAEFQIREILQKYSEWLEDRGYLDDDWRREEPKAIDWYFEEQEIEKRKKFDTGGNLHKQSSKYKDPWEGGRYR